MAFHPIETYRRQIEKALQAQNATEQLAGHDMSEAERKK